MSWQQRHGAILLMPSWICLMDLRGVTDFLHGFTCIHGCLMHCPHGALRALAQAYRREFGFTLERPVAVDDVRVRAVGRSRVQGDASGEKAAGQPAAGGPGPLPPPFMTQSAYFELPVGRTATPVYRLGDLAVGHRVAGPAILIDAISTIVVEPGCTAVVTVGHNVRMDVGE